MDTKQLNNIIKTSKNILIISHINPDGDTLGSMCALYSAILDNYKKKSDMLVMSRIPDNLKFLPNINNAKHINEFDKSRVYDLVINVDVAAYDRMFDSEILFNKAINTVNIDHHITNEGYAQLNYVLPEASSAGEVLFELLSGMDWEISLDTAKCLYTAILTDTGSFTYNNTKYNTLCIAAKLVELGVSPVEIYRNCYESKTKEQVLFQSYCINKAEFTNDDKIAYVKVYKKDLEKFNLTEDCTEGLPERLRAIKTVEIAFVVKELSSASAKVSMRSESVDISRVCAKFGGGGHKLAAGCLIKSGVKEAAKKILEEVKTLQL